MTSWASSRPVATPNTRRLAAAVSAAVVLLLLVTFGADYLSSWLPSVAGFPAGALIRDGMACAVVGCGLIVAFRGRKAAPTGVGHIARPLIAFLFFAGWVLALIPFSYPLVAGILSVRNLLLYGAVAFAVLTLWSHGLVMPRAVIAGLVAAGVLAALLGILDTLTQGRIMETLGYRRDYSGVVGSETRLVSGQQGNFGGIVRASGGISNSLVFGYLMSVLAILTLSWATAVASPRLRSRTTIALAGLAVLALLASLASLTRGAWLGLGVGVLVLVATRFRRETLLTVGAVGGLAVAIALFASPFVPAGAGTGSSAGGSSSPVGSGGLIGAITDRAGSTDEVSQISSGLRLDELRGGLAQLRAHPIGTGLGSEGAASDRAGDARQNLAPDIYALIVALQTGLPGLALWLAIFGVVVATAARGATMPGNALALAVVAVVAVASVLSAAPDAPVFSLTAWLSILVFPVWWNAQSRSGPTGSELG
jgi:hypothetical protein